MDITIEQHALRTRIQWVVVIRLAIISLSLILGLSLFDIGLGRFYYYIIFYYTVSLLYIVFVQRTSHYAFLGMLQIAVDLFAITSIVMATDPIDSVFGHLYIVAILFANILFPRYGSVLASVTSSLLFSGCVLSSFYRNPEVFRAHSDYAVYVTYIYITIFLGIGYLAHYVSNLLLEKTEEVVQLRRQGEYVFHNINTGVFLVSATGTVEYTNPAAGRILGCVPESVRGVHWHLLLGIDRVDSVLTLQQLAKGEEVEIVAYDRKGGETPLAITLSPVKEPSLDQRYNIVLFRDLREQRENERRMQDANRLSGIVDLSATIAHEIRNPLASLSGSAELLLERMLDPDSRAMAQTIVREVERVDSIVEDFLSFTRLRSFELVVVDINELMTDIAVLLYHSKKFHAKTKIIYRELPESLKIPADPRQLKQALLNLGLNALDAMPDGGEIELTVNPDARLDMIEIAVRDTGCGIPTEISDRIFEPFFSTKEDGSGIGLYVARRVAESHRGSISVESELGKGTTFRILIPSGKPDSNLHGN